MSKKTYNKPITIASGTTTAALDVKPGYFLSKVKMPAGIASTAMYIQEAPAAGGTFTRVQDGLGEYGTAGDLTFTIAASKTVTIPPPVSVGLTDIKLEFGASETDKTFTYTMQEL